MIQGPITRPFEETSKTSTNSGTDPGLKVVVVLCLIGFLVGLDLILRFPDFGAVIAQYNQF